MKTPILLSLLAGLAALPAHSQVTPSQGSSSHRPPPPPPSRLVLTLDADHNRIISATEIADSSIALAALDKNADGQLTKDEYRGPKPRSNRNGSSSSSSSSSSTTQRPPPPDPLLGALDADHDGVISASELANAPAALATLDKNGDGQLTPNEFAPPPPKPPHHGQGGSLSQSGSDNSDDQSGGGQPQGPGGHGPRGPEQGGPGGSDSSDSDGS